MAQTSSILKFINYSKLNLWDYNSQFTNEIKANYPLERLGKYLIEESIKVDLSIEPEKEYKILGISNTEGMFDAYVKKGKEFNQKYKIVKENWIAYNPYRINVGSIGIKNETISNEYISPAYVVFRCKDELLPSYLLFILKSEFGNELIKNNTTGSVRQILGFDRLCDIKIPIPKKEEQISIMNKFYEIEREIKELEQSLHTHTHTTLAKIFSTED